MIEEINDEDIDNLDFDPSDFDPQNVIGQSNYDTNNGPIRLVPSKPSNVPQMPNDSVRSPFFQQHQASRPPKSDTGHQIIDNEKDLEQYKTWQILYPCYFDRSLSHSEGRRVNTNLSVYNPQANTILQALRALGIPAILEATKTHPKDWANTGRVRYLSGDPDLEKLRIDEGLKPIKNKRHLYLEISKYLQNNPTTAETPFESVVFQQMKRELGYNGEKHCEPIAVPRGWKINSVLPVISPAITGGKGAEEMMEKMGQQMFPGIMGGTGQGGSGTAPGAPTAGIPKKVKRVTIRK